MTSLKCSAHNCCYNKNSLCSRGSISVEGADARYADDTACESFRDHCKAHNCAYNEHCKCTAASINVSGDNAHRCCDTKCDTFSCEC